MKINKINEQVYKKGDIRVQELPSMGQTKLKRKRFRKFCHRVFYRRSVL